MGLALIFAAIGLVPLVLPGKSKTAIVTAILLCWGAALISLQIHASAWPVLAAFALPYSLVIIAGVRDQRRGGKAQAEAERRFRRQEEILTLALDDAGDNAGGWLWETDRQGRLTHVSRGLAAGLDRPATSLVGKDFRTLFTGSGAGWDRLLLSMEARQPIDCAVELPLRGGRTWWQVAARPIMSDDGACKGYRAVAHDITAERLARRNLVDERDALLRHNASKSQFLAMMAHEIRTPLNTVVGYAELLLSPQASRMPDVRHREHLETLRDSSRHMQRLVADILDVTRIEKGSLRLVEQDADAAEISEVAVRMCRDAAEQAEVTIMASLIDGIELNCDATRIKQALINLVTNAVHASNPGATVHLDFELPPDGGLTIAIRDTGHGIRPDDLGRIFEPFVQADDRSVRQFGGMGLGLPIARQIALLHGGDLTIESAEGAGTTARLILPASRVKRSLQGKPETDCAA